ncbi:unnamed protein product [Blumeria hordei]|uniref:Uncharacterized protein n=1 Tax=Blumeria hordei TaxID=2867405 RepID=A0A383UNU9_BLUHO|nr:unnamed protein product [Blumeria hordei]
MLHNNLGPCELGINLHFLQPLLYTISCRRSLWKLGQWRLIWRSLFVARVPNNSDLCSLQTYSSRRRVYRAKKPSNEPA